MRPVRISLPGAMDPVPIGTPLSFHAVHIVDSALNELPEWAVGQLAVGGHCVALGYLNAPDASADRFVPDPFVARALACISREILVSADGQDRFISWPH